MRIDSVEPLTEGVPLHELAEGMLKGVVLADVEGDLRIPSQGNGLSSRSSRPRRNASAVLLPHL